MCSQQVLSDSFSIILAAIQHRVSLPTIIIVLTDLVAVDELVVNTTACKLTIYRTSTSGLVSSFFFWYCLILRITDAAFTSIVTSSFSVKPRVISDLPICSYALSACFMCLSKCLSNQYMLSVWRSVLQIEQNVQPDFPLRQVWNMQVMSRRKPKPDLPQT